MHKYFLLLCSVHKSPSAFSVGGLLLFTFSYSIDEVSSFNNKNPIKLEKNS